MMDYEPTLVQTLNGILPTDYELFANEKTTKPCITYRTNDNYDIAMADEFGYSGISYIIKIWGNLQDLSTLTTYALQIDDALRALGFTRESRNDLSYNDQIQLVLIYSATGYEDNIGEN